MLIFMGLAFLCLHALLVHFFSRSASAITYVAFSLVSAFAFGAALWRTIRATPGMHIHWILVTASLFPWIVANTIDGTANILYQSSPTAATIEDFFYFFWGIPLLLAISLPEEAASFPVFFVLDGIQAAAAGYLTYVALFSVLPFTGVPQHPMTVDRLAQVFDAEDLILALLATVRFAVGVRGSMERHFFKILAIYLWLYTICIGVYNHTNGILNIANAFDLIGDVPFLAIGAAAILFSTPSPVVPGPQNRTTSVLFLDNTRPILLGLALVALSAFIAHDHLTVALGFIFGSFVIYGVRSTLLQSHIQKTRLALEQARDRLEQIAMQDGLTGIANRRCFDQRLAFEWNRAHRTRRPLSLLLIDVDHFKQVNDTYGHLMGDECLKHTAEVLRSVLHRTGDLIARFGGEEFAILLPETNLPGAQYIAEHMRLALARSMPKNISAIGSITISIGIASWNAQENVSQSLLIETADKALYLAKQNGRDRIEMLEMDLSA